MQMSVVDILSEIIGMTAGIALQSDAQSKRKTQRCRHEFSFLVLRVRQRQRQERRRISDHSSGAQPPRCSVDLARGDFTAAIGQVLFLEREVSPQLQAFTA
jgi:hypothetical protein